MNAQPSPHTSLGRGVEFDIIRELLDEWGQVASGIGDDAAVRAGPPGQQLVVSTDATIEDVHFRRRWMSPRETGGRAATAALSDLAAMGATAEAVLVSLVVPAVWRDHLRDFASGLKQSVSSAGARIVGGNMARGGSFSCTLTVIGYTTAPVLRSTARPGDLLYVTGTLGGPGAALAAWEREDEPEPWAVARFVHPVARLAEGQWLALHGASAMIDISDGLLADSRHVAAASGVHCAIEPGLVPKFVQVTAEDAMRSGEEYELLVALPEVGAAAVAAEFQAKFGVSLTQIGRVEPKRAIVPGAEVASVVELHDGHDHFTKQ